MDTLWSVENREQELTRTERVLAKVAAAFEGYREDPAEEPERAKVDFRALVRDVQDAGIPYEPDISFPWPVRHQTALYIALGYLADSLVPVCRPSSSFRAETERLRAVHRLKRRVVEALRRVEDMGKRTRFAGWFS